MIADIYAILSMYNRLLCYWLSVLLSLAIRVSIAIDIGIAIAISIAGTSHFSLSNQLLPYGTKILFMRSQSHLCTDLI